MTVQFQVRIISGGASVTLTLDEARLLQHVLGKLLPPEPPKPPKEKK
jgi:hypothetical protein